MKTITLLGAVLALTPVLSFAQGAAVKDVTKASWVTGAADAFKADPAQITPGAAQTPTPGSQAAPDAANTKAKDFGRLAHVLTERNMTIKQVWKERKAKLPGAPRRKAPAPKKK